MSPLKKLLHDLLPPIVFKWFRRNRYGFFGKYESWQEAKRDSKGYDSPIILEKVKNALSKVKNGEAVYERDSVIFDHKEYSWPVLASLLYIVSKENRLNLVDFGGSLGSSYFQNRDFLKQVKDLRWNIVEQDNFVNYGKKHFENETLHFYFSLNECLEDTRPQVLLCSSVIQYLEKPYEVLQKIIESEFKYIIFDRTTFLANRDRLTVQRVRPGIYDASYPAWFLNEESFLKVFKEKYNVLAQFESIRKEKIDLGDEKAYEKGFFFEKK